MRLRLGATLCIFTIVSCRLTSVTCGVQTGQAVLTGVVKDRSGAAIPGSAVALVDLQTNQAWSFQTGADGNYIFSNLKPGSYRMTIDAPGFKRLIRKPVHLLTGERLRLDAVLEVGSIDETLTVISETPILSTQSGSLGQVVDNRKIVNIPLNGRNFVSLTALGPGVALPPGSAFPRINGGRPRVNEYLFDGISVLQPEPGQVAVFPVIDAIQDFRVETNSPPAEFGRFNGGVINLSTKSGTNQFHGSLFEFLRNEVLNARNLFAPKTSSNPGKPLFRRNQFGLVLGGPIAQDRTFFFADYQATIQRIGQISISTVPTLLQRQGIFSEPIAGREPVIYDPLTTRSGPDGGFTRDRFENNQIPSSRVDPVALALLNRYPLPTSSGTANNYRRLGNEKQNQHQAAIRIDHRFSETDQLFARYSVVRDLTDPVTPLPEGSGNITTGSIGVTKTVGQSFASYYLHTFSPRVTNQLRFGYNRRFIDRRARLLDTAASTALSLPGIPQNGAFQNPLPTFVIDGFQQLGPPAGANSNFRTDVTQLIDTASLQKGKHFLKAGLDFRWERLDIIQPQSPTGSFRFSSLFTDLPGTTGTGFSFASFLLGQVQEFSIDLQAKVLRPRAMIQEYFVQDDWKTTDRLTVNAGIRYTLNFPSTEADNQGAVFNLETQKLVFVGRDGTSRSARTLHKLNLGPRLGLAYRLTNNWVIRAGYGLTWIEQTGITTPFTLPNFPFIQTVGQSALDNVNPAFLLSRGPTVQLIPLTPDAGLGQGVFAVDRQLGSGYVQQWNLAVQTAIMKDLALEIAYAGSKITHVGVPDTNINQLTIDQLKLGPQLLERVPNPFFNQIPAPSSIGGPNVPRAQLLKPYPRFTTVSFYRNNVGNTNYHALQMKLEKRRAEGLSFLLSYTRSKLIDDASAVFDAAILTGPVANYPVADSFNRRLERDVSAGDMPNVFTASFTQRLPLDRTLVLGTSRFLGKLLRGWDFAGIVTVQSGLPLGVIQATNFNAFAGFGTQRPNRLATPELPSSPQSIERFFDTSAFQIAPQFTLGTSSRNPVRGPHYRNFDLALIKKAELHEGTELEFRMEIFNVTNTPPLGRPNVTLGTPGFGSVTSAGDPRVIQLALKFNF